MIEIKSRNPGTLQVEWILFYAKGGEWISDDKWYQIWQSIWVPKTNYLGCYTVDWLGNVSPWHESEYFVSKDGEIYIYDILNGTVTEEGAAYPSADIRNLQVAISGGVLYPSADIRQLQVIISGGLLYPGADIKNLQVEIGGGIGEDRFSELAVSYK